MDNQADDYKGIAPQFAGFTEHMGHYAACEDALKQKGFRPENFGCRDLGDVVSVSLAGGSRARGKHVVVRLLVFEQRRNCRVGWDTISDAACCVGSISAPDRRCGPDIAP